MARIQEIEQARTETQEGVTAAWSRLMAARAQIKSDRLQVEANSLALEGVREEEKVGQRTLLDVLNAEQEYLNAQIDLIVTRRELVVASYELLAQVGLLNPELLELRLRFIDPDVHYRKRAAIGSASILRILMAATRLIMPRIPNATSWKSLNKARR